MLRVRARTSGRSCPEVRAVARVRDEVTVYAAHYAQHRRYRRAPARRLVERSARTAQRRPPSVGVAAGAAGGRLARRTRLLGLEARADGSATQTAAQASNNSPRAHCLESMSYP